MTYHNSIRSAQGRAITPARRCGPRHRMRGVAVVEMTILLPVLLMITFLIFEGAYLFFSYNTMLHVARETSRNLAVNEFTAAEAKQFAEDQLTAMNANSFTVVVTTPDPADPSDREVATSISAPIQDLLIAGDVFDLFGASNVQARIAMREE